MNVFFKHLTNEREERDWPVVGRGGGGRRGGGARMRGVS